LIATLVFLTVVCNATYHVEGTTPTHITASDTLVIGQHIDLNDWDIEDWDENSMILSHKTDTLANYIIVSSKDTMFLGITE